MPCLPKLPGHAFDLALIESAPDAVQMYFHLTFAKNTPFVMHTGISKGMGMPRQTSCERGQLSEAGPQGYG
jgi:hypothetical protein